MANQVIKLCRQSHRDTNVEAVNPSTPKPAFSMVETVGSNLAPAPRPSKSNKRKNHRGGRKAKKKQSSTSGQDPLATPKDVAPTNTVDATVSAISKKQKQKKVKRKRGRKSAISPTETAIAATYHLPERQDDVVIHIIENDCVSPTAQDDCTSLGHRGAGSPTEDLPGCRDVDEATGTGAETVQAISTVEQESASTAEEASGDITIRGRDACVDTMTETSQGKH